MEPKPTSPPPPPIVVPAHPHQPERLQTEERHLILQVRYNGFPHKTLDQGHTLDTRAFSPDPHSEAARAGFRARHTLGFDHPHDAASPRRGTCFNMSVEEKERCGNKEGVGFVDQVGGQSAAVGVFEGIASGTKTGGTKGSGSG